MDRPIQLAVALLTALATLLSFSHSALATKIETEAERSEKQAVTSRQWNVELSLPGLEVEYGLSDRFAMGLYGDRGSLGQPSGGGGGRRGNASGGGSRTTTRTAGITGRYALTGTMFDDGWTVSSYLGFQGATIKDVDTEYSAAGAGLRTEAIVSYGIFSSSGLNLQLGLGLKYTMVRFTDLDFTDINGQPSSLNPRRINGVSPSGEIAFGWAF